MIRTLWTSAATLLLLVIAQHAWADELAIEKNDTGVNVTVSGKPFATYVFKSGNKPIIWPIVGPTGKEMTRAWPMRDGDPAEAKDHPHHRSLWFTHGDVNGESFWDENPGAGEIVHDGIDEAESGKTAKLMTRNSWMTSSGKKLCTDRRTVEFGSEEDARWIDFSVTVTAVEPEVTFGDTKEGSFGIRVNETMKVDAKKGGRIINSDGLTDAAAWGKAAAWVDYQGPVQGEALGIAILNHPKSLRYPTSWHVRTYGLFAANPFGEHDFSGGKADKNPLVLKAGESFTLRYRMILHAGDEKEGKIVERFAAYAAEDL